MMRVITILIIIITVSVPSLLEAQKKLWGRPKSQRFYIRNILRQKNPEKLRDALTTAVANTDGRINIWFALQLGEQYERIGDFENAERVYFDAYTRTKQTKTSLFKAILPMAAGTIYDSYDRLGYFYLKTGNLRKAEEIFKESMTVRKQVFPKKSVHRVQPIAGLGSLYYRKGDFAKTYQYFEQAQQMLYRATTTHFDYDNVRRLFLNDLVELCLATGKNDEAFKHLRSLSIAASGIMKFSSGISRKLEVARIFELKARYYLLTGDYQKAEEFLQKADEMNPAKIVVSDVSFKILKTRALVDWYKGNIAKSSESFYNLVRFYRSHIAQNFISMSEYEKERFYNTLKADLNLFNAYVLDIHQTTPVALYDEMYNNVINTKALLLNETNKRKTQILQSGDSMLIKKLKQWEGTKTLLAAQYYEKKVNVDVDSLDRHVEALEKEINQASQLFRDKNKSSDWTDIRNTLKQGEVAIEIVRVNTVDKKNRNGYSVTGGLSDSTVYVVMLLRPNSEHPQYFIIPEGGLLEKKYLPFYRNSIFANADDKFSYSRFWIPIKRELRGATRIFMSPDGVYNQINLNTLKNTVSEEYLIDEIELVYVTNTADLLRLKKSNAVQSAVLVGRPSYELELNSYSTSDSITNSFGLRDAIAAELEVFKEQQFQDLPGTEEEINKIEKELREKSLQVQIFKGAEALEENVKSVRQPSILHIATHGFFVEDAAGIVNPMIRSGVVLAGVKNREKGREDGILTAYEATNLDLENTRLVVLSACQTGLGEIRNGEGVYGLQRAIIVAGAQNLLMSLWKVDDQATAQLMVFLYDRWDGQNNLQAFRQAQIELRKIYPQPFYWGAFIMLGN